MEDINKLTEKQIDNLIEKAADGEVIYLTNGNINVVMLSEDNYKKLTTR